jgi:PAS domain S-box-containing protein
VSNGNGAKTRKQLAKRAGTSPLREGGPAVLEAERGRVKEVWGEVEPEKLTILDSLNELVIFQDLEHRVLWANKIAGESIGLPADKLVGQYCYDVWGRGGQACPGCPIAKALKTGKPQANEITTPDGRVWLVRGYPIRDASGDVSGLVEMAMDITERKRVVAELQGEKNKLQSLVGAMDDGLTVHDKDFNIIYQNEPLTRNYGDRLGEKCYQVYEGRDTICEDCPVQKAFNDGKSHTTERKVLLPSGEIAFGEVKASPVRDAKGRIVSCLEIIRNITKRKQAEQVLADEATRRRLLIDQSSDGIVILDQNGKVYEANQRFAEMLGYTYEEAQELSVWDWEYQFPREQVAEMIRTVDETGDHFETRHRRKDGSTFDVAISTNGAIYGGQKLIFCVCRDITERKRVEEELKAEKNKLESVISAMEDGLTIQDKDFNIIYQSELLKELFGDRIGEKCYRVYEGREDLCDGCPVKKAFKDGKSHTSERKVLMPSGEVNFWENTANPIRDANGNIVSCLEVNRNITERKQAEQALADELTRRRMLVDQSRDGIVIIDDKGKVYEANHKFAEMLGYTPEEAQELSVWDWEYQFPREQVAEMLASVNETGDHFETKHRRKDGSTFDVEISTNGAVCAGQKLIFCVCRDITERKQSERALVEAEEKYKKLVEAASDLIWEANEEGWYTFVSPNIKDILGYEVEEVLNKKRTLDFSPKKEARRWLRRFKNINAKRAAFSGFEVLHHHKNGTPVIFEISGIPFFDSNGNFKGYVGINKDITERKQMTEALRENQEFSTGLLENTPNPKSVLNPDTSIRYVNPAFEKLTGYKLSEIAGMKAPYPWWPQKVRKAMTQKLKKAMASGGKRSEHVFRKKNGEPFWVMLNSAPIVHRKKLLYFLINWLDITDRKRAEEEKAELEQKAHLASRLASVGEMASGIAHEINNPLTAVIGFAQLLMDNDLPEEIKEDLTIIHKEAQRAAGVARNLLTFARKHAPSKQLANVNGIIEGVLTLRAYEQNVSNIQINTSLASNLPEVMADYSQLQQVFINIILNAEGAMLEASNGGTLTITTKRFNHSIRASFADDGPGIKKENLNRIFDPFFTTKEVGKGTGLGLSVCHGIIAEHGGKIYARSKPGKGATFIVELPVGSAEQAEEPNEAD